ncbi:hypothetical protein FKW77_010495 [Venturia effusa]|uniref:Glycosyl transferase CAP10 domain-containing protein n=1 Tax=Venturia effusa TaxID=50376 RepID=A0A517L0I7_9PEZI|nr:hypothetical protein FKW77_010495 [Venturia effusa]
MILGRGLVVLLCISCALVVTTIAFFSHAPAGKHLRVAIFNPGGSRSPQHEGQSTSPPLSSGSQDPHSSAGSEDQTWRFDLERDGLNYGLDDAQCDAAFPDYFQDVYRTAARWKERGGVSVEDVDISWRAQREMVRAMIVDRQANWEAARRDVPRALAILHSIQRAIHAHPGELPNIEFSMCLGDVASRPEEVHAVWALAKLREQEEQWIMPDFGYWSWPNDNMGEYSQVRREIRDTEPAWNDKRPLAVWRGAPATNPLREDLIKVSEGKSWSDVKAIDWANQDNFLTMPEHCHYQYVIHTEGHSYSGRAKYLLNCASVSVTHKMDWSEPHTHLFVPTGPYQNIVVVERDWSDLDEKVEYLKKNPEVARRIAENSANTFRDRYLSPAAQACYWRKLFWAWRSVSFEPELHETVDGKRKLRGEPFESYVARAKVD